MTPSTGHQQVARTASKPWDDVKTALSSPRNAVAVAGSGLKGIGVGALNELMGLGKLAKGATYDTGKLFHDATIGQVTGERTSDWGQRVESGMAHGDGFLKLQGEHLKNVTGVSFGEGISNNIAEGVKTGDWTGFSENMGQVGFMAGSSAATLKANAAKPATEVDKIKGTGEGAKTTVLGENMSKRVIPFAEKTNARTLPFGTTAEKWAQLTPKQRWKLNDGALRTRIGEGDAFKYIGRDPYRNPALRKQFDLTGECTVLSVISWPPVGEALDRKGSGSHRIPIQNKVAQSLGRRIPT